MSIVYLDRYFHYDKDLVGDSQVFLEIGTWNGGNMKKLFRGFPDSKIIVYEAGFDNFKKLKKNYMEIGSPKNVFIHNKAVSDKDGIIKFFEYKDKPASNSVFERHLKSKVFVIEKERKISSVNLQGILKENNVNKIDIVFANAEGIEVMLLDELCQKKEVRDAIPQLCLSMHERIVGKKEVDRVLNRISEFYTFEEASGKWPCHLFRRKDLLAKGEGS